MFVLFRPNIFFLIEVQGRFHASFESQIDNIARKKIKNRKNENSEILKKFEKWKLKFSFTLEWVSRKAWSHEWIIVCYSHLTKHSPKSQMCPELCSFSTAQNWALNSNQTWRINQVENSKRIFADWHTDWRSLFNSMKLW